MKNYFKYIVVLFGVTIAVFGSLKANAVRQPNDDVVGCCAPYTSTCVKLANGNIVAGSPCEN